MFGFLKKKPAPKPVDAMAQFDQVIESLERQSAEVRKSAATLLALRAELARDEERYGQRLSAIEAKLPRAEGDVKAETTLRRDQRDAQQLLEHTREAWSQADADSRLLLQAADELSRQLQELKQERQSARTRLDAGRLVSETLRSRVVQFERLMKLDAARDEVEKAHALAELYREDEAQPR